MKPFYQLHILFFFLVFYCQGQITKANLLSSEPISASRFLGIDVLSNQYFEENDILYKKNGDQIWQYKNVILGEILKIDIINPLKIAVFFEGFNSVVLLDSQLNEIQQISFSNINKASIITSAVGIAAQNKLWFYDIIAQKIGLFNYLNEDFKYISTPFPGNFKHYESDFNNFQWIDNNLNWYSCNLFGEIKLIRQVPDFDKIQIINNDLILFSKREHLYFLDFKSNKTLEVQNVNKSFEFFIYKDQILSIFTNRQIKNYKILLP
ncbi:MAG: hypothetical protein EBR38_02210 [Flavobacteriaceae bacterium]|nr:hypothetical protein [Flavobacteriaceae bacterium]